MKLNNMLPNNHRVVEEMEKKIKNLPEESDTTLCLDKGRWSLYYCPFDCL